MANNKNTLFALVLGPFTYVRHNEKICRDGADIPILQSLVLMPNFLKQKVPLLYLLVNTELQAHRDMEQFQRTILDYFKLHQCPHIQVEIISSVEEIENVPQYLIQIDPLVNLNRPDLYAIIDELNGHYNSPFTGKTYVPRFRGHMTDVSWFTFWFLTLHYWFMQWQGWIGIRKWGFMTLAFDSGPHVPPSTYVPLIHVRRTYRDTLSDGHQQLRYDSRKDNNPQLLAHSYFDHTPELLTYLKPEQHPADDRFEKKNYQYHWGILPSLIALERMRPSWRSVVGFWFFLVTLTTLAYSVRAVQPQLRAISLKFLGTPLNWLIGMSTYLVLLWYIRYRWMCVAFYGALIGSYMDPNERKGEPRIVEQRDFPSLFARPTLSQFFGSWKFFMFPFALIHFILYYTLAWTISCFYHFTN